MEKLNDKLSTIKDNNRQDSNNSIEAEEKAKLEFELQEVLTDLECDPSLSKFRYEFQKLFQALKSSHEQEKRLAKKCRELNTEIVTNAAKVQRALQLSQEDQETITSLHKDTENAWAIAEAANRKESEAKEKIDKLQEELDRLSGLVERSEAAYITKESSFKFLSAENNELRDKCTRIGMLEAQLSISEKDKNIAQSDKKKLEEDVVKLSDDLLTSNTELENEKKKGISKEKELRRRKSELDGKNNECMDLQFSSVMTQNKVNQLECKLADAKLKMRTCLTDYDTLLQQNQKVAMELTSTENKVKILSDEAINFQRHLKACNSDKVQLSSLASRLERKLESERNTTERYKKMLDGAKATNETSQNEIHTLKKEIDLCKRREEHHKREIEVLQRERNFNLEKINKTEDKVKTKDEETHEQELIAYRFEKELLQQKEEGLEMQHVIQKLEKEREKALNDISDQKKTCKFLKEDISFRDDQIQQLQLNVQNLEDRLKEEKQTHHNLKNEGHQFSKKCIEAEAELDQFKRKKSIQDQELKNLGNVIAIKDADLAKECFESKKERTQREKCLTEIIRLNTDIECNEKEIYQKTLDLKRMTNVIKKMDEDAFMQRKEYDQVINERDLIGTQLIRRNDELALLHERIKTHENQLQLGEVEYQERIEDIRLLKLKVKELTRQTSLAKSNCVNVAEVTKELIQKNSELLREKSKVKALSDEFENPMNMHRWRMLEGRDPATYEMIQRIQSLQKRHIKKTQEVKLHTKTFTLLIK